MTVFQNIRKGLIPARLTVEDVYALTRQGALQEGENFELIDGEVVPMAAAKASDHERMKYRLLNLLFARRPSDVGVFVESSVSLEQSTLLEPDITLWPKEIASEAVRGPDILLLIEVAASSIGYDLRVKAPLYARYGVRDYWVVDAVRQTIRIHRYPVEGSYRDVEEYEAHDAVSPLLLSGFTIRLDALD